MYIYILLFPLCGDFFLASSEENKSKSVLPSSERKRGEIIEWM